MGVYAVVGNISRGLVMEQKFLFDGMVGESGRARSGNAGMRPETHTGDSAPQPVTQMFGALNAPGAE